MKKLILGLMLILSVLSFGENKSKVVLLYQKNNFNYVDNIQRHLDSFEANSETVISDMEKKGYKLVSISMTEITKKDGYGSSNNGILYSFLFEKKEIKNEKKEN